jgi:hypothetical protein
MIAAILNLGFATHHLAMALERLACALRELFLHQLGEWEKCPVLVLMDRLCVWG